MVETFYQCPVWPIVYLNLLYETRRIFTHRYDLMDALFVSFFDPRRQYSCVYFQRPTLLLRMHKSLSCPSLPQSWTYNQATICWTSAVVWAGQLSQRSSANPICTSPDIPYQNSYWSMPETILANWQPMTESSFPCKITAARPVISTRSYQLTYWNCETGPIPSLINIFEPTRT